MKLSNAFRFASLLFMVLVLRADPMPYLSPTPDPFFLSTAGFGIPNAGKIDLGPFQTANNISSQFVYQNYLDRFDGPDELAEMTATFSGELYDATGTVDLGAYSATADVTFVFVGRTDDTTGDWVAEMTQDDFAVTAGGHYFGLSLASTAIGELKVGDPVYVGGYGDGARYEYPITLSFPDVQGLFTADPPGLGYTDGGFANVPMAFALDATDTALPAVPEPSAALLLVLPAVVVLSRIRRRLLLQHRA